VELEYLGANVASSGDANTVHRARFLIDLDRLAYLDTGFALLKPVEI
jgi:hypothetical protein